MGSFLPQEGVARLVGRDRAAYEVMPAVAVAIKLQEQINRRSFSGRRHEQEFAELRDHLKRACGALAPELSWEQIVTAAVLERYSNL